MNSREASRLQALIREGERYQKVLSDYSQSGASADVSIQQLFDWYRETRSFLATQGIDIQDASDAFAMKVDWESRVETPIRRGLDRLKDIASEVISTSSRSPFYSPPDAIMDSLRRFHHDYPAKVGFIMMRFGTTQAHGHVIAAIRSTLESLGRIGVRADDKQYADDLFANILTYIYGCGFGIAVFERIEREEFNPNVSFEVGYMFGLQKPSAYSKIER